LGIKPAFPLNAPPRWGDFIILYFGLLNRK
jgi:hypothetical protein